MDQDTLLMPEDSVNITCLLYERKKKNADSHGS